MALVLPLEPSIASYRVSTTLDEVNYLLDVRWNGRDEAWYMDVLSEEEEQIASGLKLVLGAAIGSLVTHEDFPPGVFVCRDLSDEGIDATFDDLGVRVVVYYFPDSERTE